MHQRREIMITQRTSHIGRRLLVAVLGIALWGLLALPNAMAQSATFDEALDAYQFAEYQTAIDLFSEVAQDTSVNREVRKEALRYLGRAYIARDNQAQAREAIKRLVNMEPPLVELDPNQEPPPIMDLYYEVRKQLDGYGVKTRDPGMQTLAIMDFTNSSVDEKERFDPLSKGFPSMMINYMNGSTDLKVIERERIQWLLKELELQRNPELIDQSTAVRTGKLLGAQSVLFGGFTVHRDEMWISARLVKVETGEILLAEQIFGDPDEFFELVKDLSLQVTRAINVELEETQMGAGDATQSLDAQIAFSDGLAQLEDGNYRAAYEKFLEAVEYDPNYQLAKRKAESLKPMLAARGASSTPDSGN